LSQEIRKKIIDKHVKGKGYKTISKQLDVPVTTVAHIIQKFKVHGTVVNLPGRGRRRKIYDKMKRGIIRMVTKEPRTTSKEIKGELQGQGTSVSDRTIRRCLSQSGLHGRRQRRTPLLKANHKKARLEFAKMHIDKPQTSGRMSYGQMRQNWSFLARHISSMLTDAKMKHTKKRTLSLL
jgi:transposase